MSSRSGGMCSQHYLRQERLLFNFKVDIWEIGVHESPQVDLIVLSQVTDIVPRHVLELPGSRVQQGPKEV